ncbi:MAG TPA: FecR family protein [Polyangia bacterium]|jgi:transmembrane sensor|nr:FecR family protein [Polyangia bacterium]
MSRLRYPLKDLLGDPTSEEALARVWRGIDARAPRGRSRTRVWAMASVAAAAAVAIAFATFERRDRGPLRFADGRPLGAVEAPPVGAVVAMSDGSRIDLAAGARFTPLESTGTSFMAVLERGSAHFEVRPGGPRRWQIECGLATVEVVGTGFDCTRAPGRLSVSVQHGAVLVRGERVPDRARRLAAGETLEVLEPPPPAEPSPAPVGAPEAPAPTIAAAPERDPVTTNTSAWRELARGGHHREAFAALGAQGLVRETKRLGVADLLVLADVARLSGHAAEAVVPLERILRDFPGDPQAPLAALALGRLELDTLDRPAKAAAALTRALSLGVPRSLREDVRTRLVEAYARAGNRTAARAAAAAYLREYPDGRDRSIVESQMR